MTKMLALRDLAVNDFLAALELCSGDVFLVTRDGDHLNLKSRLCQLIGLSKIIEDGKIAEAFIVCQNEEDEARLIKTSGSHDSFKA